MHERQELTLMQVLITLLVKRPMLFVIYSDHQIQNCEFYFLQAKEYIGLALTKIKFGASLLLTNIK